MKNYLKKLNKKKLESLRKNHSARKDWNSLRALAKDIFEQISISAKEIKYYDFLYIIDDQDPLLQRTSNFNNFIQFYLGKRPSGRFHQEFNRNGQLIKSELEVLDGGALIISQTPDGKIVFSMFPDTIEGKSSKRNFVQRIFKNPGCVKYHHIKEAAEDFLNYALLTSPVYIPNKLEKLEIYMITKKYKEDIFPAIRTVFTWGLRILSFAKGIIIN